MKKIIPHIILGLVVLAVIFLFAAGAKRSKHRFDERLTFSKYDKIPYGMFVAYHSLKHIFPKAAIYDNKMEPGYWDSVYLNDSKQALIIISPQFDADEFQMKKIITFIESGNEVFISTAEISSSVENLIRCETSGANFAEYLANHKKVSDSFTVSLLHPPFPEEKNYSYPGLKYSAFFTKTNTATTDIIGKEKNSSPDFIHLRAGKGNLYLHLAPLAFSNYFLLHGNNIRYYENALSLINKDVTKILWDEYYLIKRWNRNDASDQPRSNWLNVLFRYKGLAAALLTAILTLVVFALLEMRRKQRYIPVIAKPRNDSLDFVKTIGRLYFEKGDHLNLCKKMSAYFLEHIRNVYKLPTNNLNEDFIKTLQFKTGVDEPEIRGIISFIKFLDDSPPVNDLQLSMFHKQLESFYKTA